MTAQHRLILLCGATFIGCSLAGYGLIQITKKHPRAAKITPPTPASQTTPPIITRQQAEAALAQAVDTFDFDEHRKSTAIGKALAQLSLFDPEKAVASIPNATAANAFFYDWAGREPAQAMQSARNLDEKYRPWVIGTIYHSWAKSDLRKAREYLQQHPDDLNGYRPVFEAWAVQDPPAAVRAAFQLKGEARKFAIDALNYIPRENLDLIKQVVRQSYAIDGLHHSVVRGLIFWSEKDPQGALSFIDSLPASRARQEQKSAILQSLSTRDPFAALEGVAQINNPDTIERMILEACAKKDPQKMLQMGLDRNQEPFARFVPYLTGKSLADRNPEDAWQTAAKIAAPGLRENFLRGAIQSIYHKDPELGMREVFRLSDVAAQRNLSQELAGYWFETSPDTAIQWALKQPENPQRAAILSETVSRRLRKDPLSALQLIETLPAGHSKDETLVVFVEQTSKYDPNLALQWALTVQDASKKTKAASKAFENWQQNDPASAAKWLQTAKITPELRQQLKQTPNP